jgi:ComF family protein
LTGKLYYKTKPGFLKKQSQLSVTQANYNKLVKNFSFFHFWQAFLFPDFCQNCQELGPMLCENCYQLIEFFWQEDLTMFFAKNFENTYFDQVKIMARFKTPISSLIKSLKYQHHSRAAKFLAQMLFFHLNVDYAKFDLITFIPIHKQKIKKRAYNQSQLIAEELALWSQKPCINLLQKTINNQAQAKIDNKQERLHRLDNAFKISPLYFHQYSLKNKKILLIDDVITTGTTINSASHILKNHGAKFILVLTLATKL